MFNRIFYLTVMGTLIFPSLRAQRTIPLKARPFVIQQRAVVNSPRAITPLFHVHAPNRSFDGTNNNISTTAKSLWGSADIPLFREIPAAYGSSDPFNAMAGANRPSARTISNSVIDEPVTTFNARGLSAFVYVWGQFLDHDLSLTPTDTIEYVPVVLPADEKIFNVDIPFYRSEVRAGSGVLNPRQQINQNTSWIDASQVYGSDADRAKWLRTFKNGKMKTSAGNFLPFNTVTGEQDAAIDPNAPTMSNDNNKTVRTFVTGDVRTAEHPGLTSLHTIFIREHNRFCDVLVAQGLRNDEQIYQLARKEVNALIQAITYQEFLPALGIRLRPYRGYDDNARPDIMNTFATAAYRVGHTMVADDILLRDNTCGEVEPGEIDLITAFWDPELVLKYQLEPFLKGFAAHTQYETDTKINSVLRNFLFTSPNDPVRFGIDLGCLNIQRGRDHGLPDYNTVRRFYTGRAARNFSDITSNADLADSLKKLYGNVNNIDLWVGALAEDHVPNTSVGFTIHEILRSQFEKLRDGDYYYYLNDPFLPSIVREQVKKTLFSDVIKRNTKLTNIQSNVFFTADCPIDDTTTTAANKTEMVPAAGGYRIYPNPVTDLVTVDVGITEESRTIQLFSTDGLLLKTVTTGAHQDKVQIGMKGLSSGIYMVRISGGKTVSSFKFVKL